MRVAIVIPRFYPYRGGYENYLLKVAHGLASIGHKVNVLTSNAFDLEAFWLKGFRTIPDFTEEVGDITIMRFPIDYRKWVRRSGRLLALAGNWRMKASFDAPGFHVRGLAAALRNVKPDIVHVGPLPYTRLMYEGLREAKACGARVIATPCTHFGEDGSDEVSRHYTRPAQIRLLNHCDALFALTHMEQQRLLELGIQAGRIRHTGFGIDVGEVTGGNAERFRTQWKVRGPVVLQLGAKAVDKGSVALVEAMKKVWNDHMDVALVLVGASTREFDNYLQHQPAMPGLLNIGPVTEDEKRDVLAAATLLAHPSRVESFGIVYLEAWANRKPVIGANTPVSREVIRHDKDGLLVPFGNVEAIREAILQLLRNPDDAALMGQNGYDKVRDHHSWNALLPGILRVFSDTSTPVQTNSLY